MGSLRPISAALAAAFAIAGCGREAGAPPEEWAGPSPDQSREFLEACAARADRAQEACACLEARAGGALDEGGYLYLGHRLREERIEAMMARRRSAMTLSDLITAVRLMGDECGVPGLG